MGSLNKQNLVQGNLFQACSDGKLDEIRKLLTKDNVNQVNADGYSPLLLASRKGNLYTIKLLMTTGADPCMVTAKRSSALHLAVKQDFNPVTVKELLESGVPVNMKNDFQQTALVIAVLRKMRDIVDILVKNGADICAVDRNEMSPLHYACQQKNMNIVQLLLQSANVDVIKKLRTMRNSLGQSAAHIAAHLGMYAILQALIEKECIDYSVCDMKGQSVVITACTERHIQCTCLLLDNAPSNFNVSSLEDANGNNLLHIASLLGEVELIPKLIKLGVSVTAKNDSDLTPFGCAIIQGYEDICAQLIPFLFPANQPMQSDDERLHEIHLAAMHGRDNVIKELIAHNVDITGRDHHGSNALHEAASHGFMETVKILLEAGVDPRDLNRQGKSAADLAETVNHHEMAMLIRNTKKKAIFDGPLKSINLSNNREENEESHCNLGSNTQTCLEVEPMEMGEALAVVKMAARAMPTLPRTSECEDMDCNDISEVCPCHENSRPCCILNRKCCGRSFVCNNLENQNQMDDRKENIERLLGNEDQTECTSHSLCDKNRDKMSTDILSKKQENQTKLNQSTSQQCCFADKKSRNENHEGRKENQHNNNKIHSQEQATGDSNNGI